MSSPVASSFPDVLRQVCGEARRDLGATWSLLLLYDDLADTFTVAAADGEGLERLIWHTVDSQRAPAVSGALEEDQVVLLPAETALGRELSELVLGSQTVLLVPLPAPSSIGVLVVDHHGTELSPDERVQAQHVGAESGKRIQAARPEAGHYCLFRRIINVAPAGIAVVEGPDHLFSYAAPAFRQMLGLERVPFLGRPARDVIAGSSAGAALLDEVRRTGQPRRLTSAEVTDQLGARFYDVHIVPEHSLTGLPAALFIILWPRTDVVQARRALEATIVQLADAQNTLAAVLDSTANGIFFTDPDGTIRYANRRVGELLGVDPRAAVGTHKLDLMEIELMGRMQEPERFADRLRSIYADPDATAVDEIEILSPTRRILERYSGPVYKDDGTRLGRIDVYADVSEVRELQRSKDEFLSVVSHELKTPVTSIKGYIQLLRKRGEREGASRQTLAAYEVIERQTARMQNLIDMLLDLSRIESGKMSLQRAPVELCSLMRDMATLARMTTDEHDIRLDLPSHEVWIDGDASRLEQVFTNLLSNAIRYSTRGGVIEVWLQADAEAARLSVRDHGIGIPPDALPRIFERFFRVGGDPSNAGLGIGLFIANSIVQEHGGTIEVESTIGRGSTFTVALPIKP